MDKQKRTIQLTNGARRPTNKHGQEADVTFWTCGQGGHCRRFCYAHEYVVGYHGCPRRFRCCVLRY
uniref:Defensin n=1 Tax=Acipenser dabryanus TaxID=62061 RepID=A0A481WHH5_ACIDA|nr:defensin [Acipenser dabryanus]